MDLRIGANSIPMIKAETVAMLIATNHLCWRSRGLISVGASI